MNYPEKYHKTFLRIAIEMSKLSHCVSHQVGCVLVKDGRILSTGINGTPVGYVNCDKIFKLNNFDRIEHHKFSENYEIHAELNAILFAAKNGISIDGSNIYCTLHPCNNCLKMLCNSGIKNIYYLYEYDKFMLNNDILKMLKASNINLIKVYL